MTLRAVKWRYRLDRAEGANEWESVKLSRVRKYLKRKRKKNRTVPRAIICSWIDTPSESSEFITQREKMSEKKKIIHNKLMLFIAIVGLLMESKWKLLIWLSGWINQSFKSHLVHCPCGLASAPLIKATHSKTNNSTTPLLCKFTVSKLHWLSRMIRAL